MITELEQIECDIVNIIDCNKNYKSVKERHEMISGMCSDYIKYKAKGIDLTIEQLYNIKYKGETK